MNRERERGGGEGGDDRRRAFDTIVHILFYLRAALEIGMKFSYRPLYLSVTLRDKYKIESIFTLW